jgi:hypothetical protein
MDAQDWTDLASVYQAGSDRARGWAFNTDRQQEAEILEAQADRCREIARERQGNPPTDHVHYHFHVSPDGKDRLMHRHLHAHGEGETEHEGHEHDEYGPGRDPFAPLLPLFPPERSEQ